LCSPRDGTCVAAKVEDCRASQDCSDAKLCDLDPIRSRCVPDETISDRGLDYNRSEGGVLGSTVLGAAVVVGVLGGVAAIWGVVAWRANSAQGSSRSVSMADPPAAAPSGLDAAPTGGSLTWRF
jgi:hypothetical protein